MSKDSPCIINLYNKIKVEEFDIRDTNTIKLDYVY